MLSKADGNVSALTLAETRIYTIELYHDESVLDHDEYFYVQSIARPGQTISSTKYERRVGGKGANQAIALARAGGTVDLSGAVGEDGLWVKEHLASFGVNVGGVEVVKEPTGRAIIQLAEDGENSIILFPGANHSRALDSNPRSHLNATNATHILVQNEIHPISTLLALSPDDKAKIFNPSPLPSQEEVAKIPWGMVTWLIVNQGEARELYYLISGETKEKEIPIRALVRRLSNIAAGAGVVCTLGADGVLAYLPSSHRPETANDTQQCMYLPAAKLQGPVRDTTGAGDCFTGYFVQGLMELGAQSEITERDLERILKRCVVAAGMCVEKWGTIDSIPTRAEVEARISYSPSQS